MSAESYKELDDFFRSMRQAYNNRDIKTFRSHFWTDKRFVHLDESGRSENGWGSFEETTDQDFRYLESVKLELKELQFQVFEDQFATVAGQWKRTQIDSEGRESEQAGWVTYSVARVGDDWKIVAQHFSTMPAHVNSG